MLVHRKAAVRSDTTAARPIVGLAIDATRCRRLESERSTRRDPMLVKSSRRESRSQVDHRPDVADLHEWNRPSSTNVGQSSCRSTSSSRATDCFSGITSQCSGTSPSHSMPEGFMGACGFRPLVTAWEMTAWRFSFSSSISRRCSATSASIFAVSRSRNAAIAACSSSGGTGNAKVFEVVSRRRYCPVASSMPVCAEDSLERRRVQNIVEERIGRERLR